MLTVIPLLFVAAVFFKTYAVTGEVQKSAMDAYFACIFVLMILGAIACAENLGWI